VISGRPITRQYSSRRSIRSAATSWAAGSSAAARHRRRRAGPNSFVNPGQWAAGPRGHHPLTDQRNTDYPRQLLWHRRNPTSAGGGPGARAPATSTADSTPELAVSAGFPGRPAKPAPSVRWHDSVHHTHETGRRTFFRVSQEQMRTTLRNRRCSFAAGDVNGDGKARLDLRRAARAGAPGACFILSGALDRGETTSPGATSEPDRELLLWRATRPIGGGVRVAAEGKPTATPRADVVIGSGKGSPSKVRVLSRGKNFTSSGEPANFPGFSTPLHRPFSLTGVLSVG